MKKLLLSLLFIAPQAQAIIVNYTKIISPDGKKTIHLFADQHIPNKEVAEKQKIALQEFLLNNRNAILYIDGYVSNAGQPSAIAQDYKNQILKDKHLGILSELLKQGIMEQTLAQVTEYALMHDLPIKDDPRITHVLNGGSQEQLQASLDGDLDLLESAIFADCMANDNHDIIVIAGVIHLPKLEKLLKEKQFLVKSIKDTREIVQTQLKRESEYYEHLRKFTSRMGGAMESSEQLEKFITEVHTSLWDLGLIEPLSAGILSTIE